MKFDSVNQNKMRVFLTLEDLSDRGIHKDDIWQEVAKAKQLFQDMMEQAREEVGFDTTGPLVVEVFVIPAQGMLVVVSRTTPSQLIEQLLEKDQGSETDSMAINIHTMQEDDQTLQLQEEHTVQLKVEQSTTIVFSFTDFEYLVAVAKRIGPRYTDAGELYRYEGEWFLLLNAENIEQRDDMVANLAEFGQASILSPEVVRENGCLVMRAEAIEIIRTTF